MRLRRTFQAAIIAIALGGAVLPLVPSEAQVTGETGRTDADRDDTDFGWLGLVGLVGLAGLMRRPDRGLDRHATVTR